MHRLVRLSATVAAALCVVGCSTGSGDTALPPLTEEPGAPLTVATPAPAAASYPARLVLLRYLRGVAAGNAGVCALVGPEYAEAAFGAAGCRAGFAAARRGLAAADLAALRTVTVPAATIGPGPADYTVDFTELGWRGESARPGGLLVDAFVLRRTGTGWVVTVR